jgi:hypothetical protein
MSRALRFAIGGLFLAQSVAAQPGSPPPPAAAPPAAPAPAEADIGVRARAVLSPQEMLEQSRGYRDRIQQTVARIEQQIEQARNEKDIIRINCLTDKLVQARAHLAIANQAVTNLTQAVGRADEGATMHEYTRVTIVSQKVQVLANEADQCVGEDLSFVGATRVDVDVDPGVRPDDPTQVPPPDVDPIGPRPDTQSPAS